MSGKYVEVDPGIKLFIEDVGEGEPRPLKKSISKFRKRYQAKEIPHILV